MPYCMWGIVVAPLTSIVPFFLAPYIGMGSMGQAATRNKAPALKIQILGLLP